HDVGDVGLARAAHGDLAVGQPRARDGRHRAQSGELPATMPARMHRPLARLAFWAAAAKLAWTQVGYGLFLAALRRARGNPPPAPAGDAGTPSLALIVAAYAEEAVIAAKVEN